MRASQREAAVMCLQECLPPYLLNNIILVRLLYLAFIFTALLLILLPKIFHSSPCLHVILSIISVMHLSSCYNFRRQASTLPIMLSVSLSLWSSESLTCTFYSLLIMIHTRFFVI